MSPLEAALSRPIAFKVSKPRKLPFYKTVTASKQRIYRQVIEALPTGEWRAMRFILNRWFRHQGRPVAPGYETIAKGIGYTVRQVRRLLAILTGKGFIRAVKGGVGRGNVTHIDVDLWAIQKALKPDLLEEKKGDISVGAYNKELKIGRAYRWFAGIVGRSANFASRLERALAFDRPWIERLIPAVSPHTDQRQANFSRTTGDVEAGV